MKLTQFMMLFIRNRRYLFHSQILLFHYIIGLKYPFGVRSRTSIYSI